MQEFNFEYELDEWGNNKGIIFNYTKQKEYAQELKNLIKQDLANEDKIEREFIKVKFLAVSRINVFVECDKWLIRDDLEGASKQLDSIIKKNITRLNVPPYFLKIVE